MRVVRTGLKQVCIDTVVVMHCMHLGRGKDISKSDKDIRILEALSATGLRSLRYALEVPDLREVIANDISLAAFEAIQRNINFNQLSGKVTAHCEDAR